MLSSSLLKIGEKKGKIGRSFFSIYLFSFDKLLTYRNTMRSRALHVVPTPADPNPHPSCSRLAVEYFCPIIDPIAKPGPQIMTEAKRRTAR